MRGFPFQNPQINRIPNLVCLTFWNNDHPVNRSEFSDVGRIVRLERMQILKMNTDLIGAWRNIGQAEAPVAAAKCTIAPTRTDIKKPFLGRELETISKFNPP